MTEVDVAVVGGGAVGVSTAVGLAQAGVRVLLAGHVPQPREDGRTAALMAPSVDFLRSIGALDGLAGHPLAAIRLIDIKGGLIRAPTTVFRAREIDLDAFARNYSNAELVGALNRRAAADGVVTEAAQVTAASFDAGRAMLTLANGAQVAARFVVAADGARSLLREVAGIGVRAWRYDQVALTFHVAHSRDHEDISTEFHTPSGPLTFVPFGDFRSSVVWLLKPREADVLLGNPQRLAQAAQRRSSSLLGDLTLAGPVGRTPMHGLMATSAVAPRVLLAGEALHVFPPIGAQGLNLGLRDAEAAIDALKGIAAADADAASIAAAYQASRRSDAASRTLGVDMLNRSLLTALLPLDIARSAGLSLIGAVPPLRRALMRAGMGQSPLAGMFAARQRKV